VRAVNKAGAFGIASFNTSGNVTANFSIVTAPGGKPVHVSAIQPGDRRHRTDSAGNTGTFRVVRRHARPAGAAVSRAASRWPA
jgi:hypothetical protein